MKKIYGFHIDDIINFAGDFKRKCGNCNWDTPVFYCIANSKENAKKQIKRKIKNGTAPLCAECTVELLISENYILIKGGKNGNQNL